MLNQLVKDAGPPVAYASYMESMGDRIRQLRIARGLTQTALGEQVGVTKSAVSQWEDGSTANVKLQVFMRLCAALRTDPHYLIYGETRGPDHDTGSTGRFRRPGGAQRK
jgi:transcriptional regulator with XRE-family HTH domain